jgi:small subunit ribosomal protein S7
MPRRPVTPKRPPRAPDARYGSLRVAQFINKIMMRGKKSLAERIVYDAFARIEQQTRRAPLDVFEQAVRNATPVLEVKPRRVGGSTYQVPVEIKGDRRTALAMRWLVQFARRRAGKSMSEKLAAELLDAANNTGTTIRRREEVHRMAEANRAFSHYRW